MRIADVVVINKMDTASPENIQVVRESIDAVNPSAIVVDGASPIRVEDPSLIKGKKVLVITGPTSEPLDDIRIITNNSTGRTGIYLALEAYYRGADVEVWAGKGVDAPDILGCKRFGSVKDLEALANDANADIILVPAAISDFLVKKTDGKMSSSKPASVELTPAPKILSILRKNTKALIVGFKAETNISLGELESRAIQRMKEHGLSIIIANLLEDVEAEKTKALILRKDGKKDIFELKKSELATMVFDIIKGE